MKAHFQKLISSIVALSLLLSLAVVPVSASAIAFTTFAAQLTKWCQLSQSQVDELTSTLASDFLFNCPVGHVSAAELYQCLAYYNKSFYAFLSRYGYYGAVRTFLNDILKGNCHAVLRDDGDKMRLQDKNLSTWIVNKDDEYPWCYKDEWNAWVERGLNGPSHSSGSSGSAGQTPATQIALPGEHSLTQFVDSESVNWQNRCIVTEQTLSDFVVRANAEGMNCTIRTTTIGRDKTK